MLRGMTAYAKVVKKSTEAEFVVDIQSVNRKSLDITVKLPLEYSCFEPTIRKLLAEYALRGYITCTIQCTKVCDAAHRVEVNTPYAKSLFRSLNALANELGIVTIDHTALFSFMLKEKGILQVCMNETVLEQQIRDAVRDACHLFVEVKEKEGALVVCEITERMQKIEEFRLQIEAHSFGISEKYKQRLLKLLSELQSDIANDERVLKECAIIAEKVDISEELSRLKAHMDHMKDVLQSLGCGKTLEFILQEMQREANTIASKSQNAEISRLVIMIKSEIEKMREQVQNVE